jgi:endonuclease YncB( thermonuclease family)
MGCTTSQMSEEHNMSSATQQNNLLEKLKTSQMTDDHSFNGYEGWAKVVSVLDGDTLRIKLIYKGDIIQLRVRCAGYNSPELKPSLKHENRQREIENANRSMNRIIELTTNCHIDFDHTYSKQEIKQLLTANTKLIYVKLYNFDNFGRTLAVLYQNDNDCQLSKLSTTITNRTNTDNSINQQMIKEKHAVEYYGERHNKNKDTLTS